MEARPLIEAAALPQMSVGVRVFRPGETITIDLPGETTRARIVRVVAPKLVVAELLVYTTSKEHQRKKGDVVACGLEPHPVSRMTRWRALTDAEMEAALQRAPEEKSKPKRKRRGTKGLGTKGGRDAARSKSK